MNSMQARRTLGLSVLLFLLAMAGGCSTPQTTLVLMPDPDGSVGQATISNKSGTRTLDQAGQVARAATPSQAPTKPTPLGSDEINAIFKDALRARPLAPEQFTVHFELGTPDLTAESKQQLPAIIAAIRHHPVPEIMIVGHTDRVGNARVNYQLAMERAVQLKRILEAAGIEARMMEVQSHGESNPLIATPDEVAEPRNRRVTVYVR